MTKLEQVLPSRLRHRVGAVSSATVSLSAADAPSVDPVVLATVASASADGQRLRFGYVSADGICSRRRVEPGRAHPDRPAVHGAAARWRGSGRVRDEQAVLEVYSPPELIDHIAELVARVAGLFAESAGLGCGTYRFRYGVLGVRCSVLGVGLGRGGEPLALPLGPPTIGEHPAGQDSADGVGHHLGNGQRGRRRGR